MPKLMRLDQKTVRDPEYLFWCPGCGDNHWFKTTGKEPRWTFNGDMERPTVHASILVKSANRESDRTCHLFIQDGRIQYLNDCSHDLAGQTVNMEDVGQ
ncbi:MAG: hypothetical protein A2516_01630 [Alphaproteobacteria bacterium RIFOXYD12_FULL_60_8]|nr:MAG: hypothetical protein A2516_01630 [Alphaproteobacteria bacterium RIFOXYD12_FULL_60_8]